MPSENEPIARKFFDQCEYDPSMWVCKCGKMLTQKRGTGWTNLMNHIKSQHAEYTSLALDAYQNVQLCNFASNGTTANIVSRTTLASTCGWIEWVCCGLKPFSFVEDTLTRKHTRLEVVTGDLLRRHMEKLVADVESRISCEIPDRFALVLDGWNRAGVDYCALFASYPHNNRFGHRTVLLGFSPLHCDPSQTSVNHAAFIRHVLAVNNRSLEDVVSITCEHSQASSLLADLSSIPLIGCAMQRLSLAVDAFIGKESALLEKVNALMGRLRSVPLAAQLRERSPLLPVQRSKDQWLTTCDVVERYFQLQPDLVVFQDDPVMGDYLLSAKDHGLLCSLAESLRKFRSVASAVQKEGTDLCDVRLLFDELIALYPDENFESFLGSSANIVLSENFEDGVVKLLQQSALNADQETALRHLKIVAASPQQSSPENSDDFASMCLKKRRISASLPQQFMDCRFLLASSQILQRQLGDSLLNDFQHLATCHSLDLQLFLKVNHIFWDDLLVSKVINRP